MFLNSLTGVRRASCFMTGESVGAERRFDLALVTNAGINGNNAAPV